MPYRAVAVPLSHANRLQCTSPRRSQKGLDSFLALKTSVWNMLSSVHISHPIFWCCFSLHALLFAAFSVPLSCSSFSSSLIHVPSVVFVVVAAAHFSVNDSQIVVAMFAHVVAHCIVAVAVAARASVACVEAFDSELYMVEDAGGAAAVA